jgi:hydrogenase expression/formation protein HypE
MSTLIGRAHGTGGRSTHKLIDEIFHPLLQNDLLSPNDAAIVPWNSPNLIVTTDAHVVEPIIFPGGDIGKLAVTGVINDLLTQGGRPLYISLTFILDEGLALSKLKQVVQSIAVVLHENSIRLLCADTKVVPPRGQPGMMISSTLFGEPFCPSQMFHGPKAGDKLIVTASLGSHGLALLSAREKLPFKTSIISDCQSLMPLLAPLLLENRLLHCLRDVTRGGLAGVLHEWSRQHQVGFEIDETQLPVRAEVKAGLDLLGIDLLEVANEGVMLIALAEDSVTEVLAHLRASPMGRESAVIGETKNASKTPLVLRTKLGGRRLVAWPEALNLPRIC